MQGLVCLKWLLHKPSSKAIKNAISERPLQMYFNQQDISVFSSVVCWAAVKRAPDSSVEGGKKVFELRYY